MQLTLFSLVVKSLDFAGAEWRSNKLTEYLESQTVPSKQWHILVATLSSKIREHFYAEAKKYKAVNFTDLTVSTYFKSQSIIQRLFELPLPPQAKTAAKSIVAEL